MISHQSMRYLKLLIAFKYKLPLLSHLRYKKNNNNENIYVLKKVYLIMWNLEYTVDPILLIHLLKCHIINPIILIFISQMNFTDLCLLMSDTIHTIMIHSTETIYTTKISEYEINFQFFHFMLLKNLIIPSSFPLVLKFTKTYTQIDNRLSQKC